MRAVCRILRELPVEKRDAEKTNEKKVRKNSCSFPASAVEFYSSTTRLRKRPRFDNRNDGVTLRASATSLRYWVGTEEFSLRQKAATLPLIGMSLAC